MARVDATAGQGGVVADPLFVGVTRPAMALGVTYSALLANGIATVELFLLTRNLLWLAVCLPVHGLCWLLCQSEPRFFDLLMLWGRTRGPGLFGNARRWRANGYSALGYSATRTAGERRWPAVRVPVAAVVTPAAPERRR